MTDLESRESRAWAMLTARAQQYEISSRSFGSLRPSDVAAMLAGLDERPFSAGMLCEAGDWSSLPRVASYLYYDAIELAADWNLPRGVRQLKSLVYLSLLEATGPSVACTACEVDGKPNYGSREICKLCEGRRRLPVLQQTRADIIEVNESNWKRTWRDRYYHVDRILQDWLSDARGHLSEALAGRPRKLQKRRA